MEREAGRGRRREGKILYYSSVLLSGGVIIIVVAVVVVVVVSVRKNLANCPLRIIQKVAVGKQGVRGKK